MITFQVGNLLPEEVPVSIIWTIIGIFLAIELAFYVLRSIGLFVLGKRQSIKHSWAAWLPCVWIYVAVKLVGKTRFFGKPMQNFAYLFAIIFIVAEGLTFAYGFIIYFPLVGNFLAGREICFVQNASVLKSDYYPYVSLGSVEVYVNQTFVNPYKDLNLINMVLNGISIASTFTDLATIIIEVTLYINLFKRFWPKHFVLASILSIFLGLFAPLVFAIRKKDPVNYIDYLRSKYSYYPYGMPYGNNQYGGPQNRCGYGPVHRPDVPDYPFEEFAERGDVDPGEPFGEFSQNDKDKDKGE